jgi:hypothetical protein
MRRCIRYLDWKAEWWIARAVDEDLNSPIGLACAAYAQKQASIIKARATHWRTRWTNPVRYQSGSRQHYLTKEQMGLDGPLGT